MNRTVAVLVQERRGASARVPGGGGGGGGGPGAQPRPARGTEPDTTAPAATGWSHNRPFFQYIEK